MRPFLTLTMCAYLAVAAAPALAVQSNYFIKLDGMDVPAAADRDKHIEISSWQWGATQAKGKVEHEWKVEEGESAPPPPGTAKFGAVAGAHRDDSIGGSKKMTVDGGRTETASGQATGKRQHKPLRTRAYVDQSAPAGETARFNPKEISVAKRVAWQGVSQPLDRGAVRVKVKLPWVGCRVGAHYPALMLGGGAQRYELQDAIVTSCGARSASDERPTEEVSFNYGKVTVHGWDPAVKQR
ncbi:MAG TPA: hypothetical protein VGR05_09135 [Sphingomicrobium sp.]|nr:hypothetical protein [Sphingomicrobium sp.]